MAEVDRIIVVHAAIVGDPTGRIQRWECPAKVESRNTYKGVPCIDLPRHWGLVK